MAPSRAPPDPGANPLRRRPLVRCVPREVGMDTRTASSVALLGLSPQANPRRRVSFGALAGPGDGHPPLRVLSVAASSRTVSAPSCGRAVPCSRGRRIVRSSRLPRRRAGGRGLPTRAAAPRCTGCERRLPSPAASPPAARARRPRAGPARPPRARGCSAPASAGRARHALDRGDDGGPDGRGGGPARGPRRRGRDRGGRRRPRRTAGRCGSARHPRGDRPRARGPGRGPPRRGPRDAPAAPDRAPLPPLDRSAVTF